MSTLFLLLAEYGTGQIPLERCAHIFGLRTDEAAKRAGRQALPVPVFRAGTQKSPWIIEAAALASFLNDQKSRAQDEWKKIHG
jgi:hypothetical protein